VLLDQETIFRSRPKKKRKRNNSFPAAVLATRVLELDFSVPMKMTEICEILDDFLI
jgi:hypothetical protein